MVDIVAWNDIKDDYHKGSLLLGNGSSIAVSTCFNYPSLYEKAIELNYLTDNVQAVFDKFKVNDFELVLRRLWQAKLVNEALQLPRGEVEVAYEEVRMALIETVRDTHVSYDNAREYLLPIYKFMQEFDYVISLNYDLIVYWAAMLGIRETKHPYNFVDGFIHGEFKHNWEELREQGRTLFFYPHGNLVLRREGFSGERKIQTGNNDNLLEAILELWVKDNLVPAFVCEGTEESKLDAISSCNYFEHVFYEVLPALEGGLVIYGWGFGDQDEHIIAQLAKSKIKRVAVSIFGGDLALCGKIESKLERLNLEELVFFDSTSEGCWNNLSTEDLEEVEKEKAEFSVSLAKVLGKV